MPCSHVSREPKRCRHVTRQWNMSFPPESFILSKNCCDIVNSCSSNLLGIYFFPGRKPDLFPDSSEEEGSLLSGASVDLPSGAVQQHTPSVHECNRKRLRYLLLSVFFFPCQDLNCENYVRFRLF